MLELIKSELVTRQQADSRLEIVKSEVSSGDNKISPFLQVCAGLGAVTTRISTARLRKTGISLPNVTEFPQVMRREMG